MKKAKVSRIIDEQKREAFAAGKRAGINEEKKRTTRLFPIRDDGLVYLDPPPKEKRRLVHIRPGYVFNYDPMIRNYPLDDSHRMLGNGGLMLEFEAIQKNIAFTNGLRVVWFDWKPIGPYPVTEPAVTR